MSHFTSVVDLGVRDTMRSRTQGNGNHWISWGKKIQKIQQTAKLKKKIAVCVNNGVLRWGVCY